MNLNIVLLHILKPTILLDYKYSRIAIPGASIIYMIGLLNFFNCFVFIL